MKINDYSKFNSILIKQFNVNDEDFFKKSNKVKYHYTSPDAFLSIIKNKVLRFTDIRFMNDKSEKLYFVKLLYEYLEKNKGRYHQAFEAISELLKENDILEMMKSDAFEIKYNNIKGIPYKSMNSYVFCMCGDADSLNMWNYYVNNNSYQGYNIGFDTYKLLSGFDTQRKGQVDCFGIYYGNVLYDRKKQEAEIEVFAQNLENMFIHETCFDIISAQLVLRDYIDSYAMFYKHPKFKSENEFRIIISINEDMVESPKDSCFSASGRSLKKEYHVKNGFIIPCLSLQFSEDVISRIYISPTTEFDVAKIGVSEFIKSNKFNGISVCKSNIPIRF